MTGTSVGMQRATVDPLVRNHGAERSRLEGHDQVLVRTDCTPRLRPGHASLLVSGAQQGDVVGQCPVLADQ